MMAMVRRATVRQDMTTTTMATGDDDNDVDNTVRRGDGAMGNNIDDDGDGATGNDNDDNNDGEVQ